MIRPGFPRIVRMPLTPAVTALLWALAIGFGLQYVGGDTLERWLMLWPLGEFTGRAADGSLVTVGFMPWQVVTYAFLHDGFGHLFFNALAVWMFGAPVEEAWGRKRFLTFWFVCVVGAGVLQLAVVSSGLLGGGLYPTLGASGGVYG